MDGPNARAVPGDRRDWIDDPWYDLLPEQAWRDGWEAARKQAMRVARQVPIPEECNVWEAHGRLMGVLGASESIAAMEPPA